MGTILSTETTPKRIGRKGRRNNPVEYRRRLAQLACEPGVSVARVAIEHGLNTNLLFKWRRAYLAGEYDVGTLMPVSVMNDAVRSAPSQQSP
ncbi:transposase [Paraburkholderia sp.]|uniref:transposase n=1 Tax=Paraburkholderia sp. TaxID=1926495 RepID=UPI00261A0D50|nr:transposase [Paraburkholderia sp.]